MTSHHRPRSFLRHTLLLSAIGALSVLALAPVTSTPIQAKSAWAGGTRAYETLTLRYQGSEGAVTLPELADALGYLEPLKLDWVGNTISGPQDIQSAATGQIDFGGAFDGAIVNLIAAGARGHREIKGTPEAIADQMEDWFINDAADGFNIMPPYLPAGLDDFVDLVIPELQRRGLFRTEYTGHTLRDHLGLSRPVSQFARRATAVS